MIQNNLWAIYDPKDKTGARLGCFKVRDFQEARVLNNQKYAIYFTPNDFKGERREENLERINYCFCDIDGGDKEEQMKRINDVIPPSIIVESKNGYHCYWRVENVSVDGFKRIEKGIIRKLGADPHASDLPRLLRLPSFYHWKDPNDPFLVRVVSKNDTVFNEDFMLFHFPAPREKKFVYTYNPEKTEKMLNPENWEHYFKLSQIQEGSRNSMLKDQVYKAYKNGIVGNDLRELSLGLNEKLTRPLPKHEVLNMMRGLR